MTKTLYPGLSFFFKKKKNRYSNFLFRKTKWEIKDFIVEECLGSGKFGVVWRAIERRTNRTVALKILRKEEIEAANVVHFLKREIEIQVHLE